MLSRPALTGISGDNFAAALACETLNPSVFQWPTKHSLVDTLIVGHGNTPICCRFPRSTELLRVLKPVLIKIQDSLQALGISNRVPTEIIIKIEICILPPGFNLFGPGLELYFRIVRGIELLGTMKADIHKIRGSDFIVWISPCRVCDAKGDVVLFQDGKKPIRDPGRMPDLQSMAKMLVQALTKTLKFFFIKRKTGRELK
jgi:hypothetical protein